jgi:hypothetical protein
MLKYSAKKYNSEVLKILQMAKGEDIELIK